MTVSPETNLARALVLATKFMSRGDMENAKLYLRLAKRDAQDLDTRSFIQTLIERIEAGILSEPELLDV